MRQVITLLFLLFCQAVTCQTWTAKPGVAMSSANVGGYWEYLPAGYGATPKPVIICLHGSGERGDGDTQINLVLNQGLPYLINTRFGTGNAFPYDCIVIAPQYTGATLTSGRTQDIINFVRNNYNVDTNRIYLTGLSLGAEAITNWWFNGTLTGVAACLIISTPSSYYADGAVRAVAANLPTFWVHGLADSNPFTPYTRSERWVNGFVDNGWPGLNGLGINPPAILKLLPGVDHSADAWNSAHDWNAVSVSGNPVNDYGGGLIMDWLLAQTRSSSTLTNTLIGKIGATTYRWKLYSDNSYTVETHNGTTWVSSAAAATSLRGRISGTNYRWTINANSTYSSQTSW
jgi:predicted esterase